MGVLREPSAVGYVFGSVFGTDQSPLLFSVGQLFPLNDGLLLFELSVRPACRRVGIPELIEKQVFFIGFIGFFGSINEGAVVNVH